MDWLRQTDLVLRQSPGVYQLTMSCCIALLDGFGFVALPGSLESFHDIGKDSLELLSTCPSGLGCVQCVG